MWQTKTAYVPSEKRIERIEKIPLIYGIITSGAIPDYRSKKEYPVLAGLIEGGFATDIYLKKDPVKKKMYINELDDENTFRTSGKASQTDPKTKGKYQTELPSDTLLETGEYLPANLSVEERKKYKLFWYNGNRNVVLRHDEDESLIPIVLAENLVSTVPGINSNILNSMPKIDKNGITYVSSKKLAELLGVSNLYSRWEYHGMLNIMINTLMKESDFKLRRENANIYISLNLRYSDKTDYSTKIVPLCKNSKDSNPVKKLEWSSFKYDNNHEKKGIDSYLQAIRNAKDIWGGNYQLNEKSDMGGYANIILNFDLSLSSSISNFNTIIKNSIEESAINNSHCDIGSSWQINNIGNIFLYNRFEYEISETAFIELLDIEDYKLIAAHEMGHLMGLGESYYDYVVNNDEIPHNNIMEVIDINNSSNKVFSNDIELLFLASLLNKKQYYGTGDGHLQSIGIDS